MATDRLHPLRVQLRDRGRSSRAAPREDPRRQGPSRLPGLHVQQGDAPRPLPERPPPADVSAAPARRRHATRRSTGTPRSPRSPAGFARIRDEHGGESIFYYGGGGRETTSAAPTAARSSRRSASRYRSSALAQEKTGEAWVDAQLYGGHTRGEFEHAEVAVFVGKNPWMSQSFPRARVVLREIAKDPGALDDRHRPGRDRHREARRLPPARAPGHRCLVPRRARRDARPGGAASTTRSSPST